MAETFNVLFPKDPVEKGPIDIDVTIWLSNLPSGTDSISNVDFTAFDAVSGSNVTSTLLDPVKSTYNGVHVRPWIMGGTSGKKYKVICKVTTVAGSVGIFVVYLSVRSS